MKVLELMLDPLLQKLQDRHQNPRYYWWSSSCGGTFEARRPKEGNVGQMAKIDGIVSEAGTLRSKKGCWLPMKNLDKWRSILIPHGKHVLVQPGDFAQKGQLITEGAKDPS